MSGESARLPPGELFRALRDEAGLPLATLTPAGAGESGAAFWVTGHAGTVSLLKIIPEPGPAVVADLRVLGATVGRLRDRGYPAAPLTALGRTAAFAFWIRDRLGARLLELAGHQAARAYLAHMVLRQVDWSVRHHPAAAATRRHLRLARLIIADIRGSKAPWPGQ